MLYEPVKRLTGIYNIFQQALGATQRVFEYLDRPESIQERPGAFPLKRFEKAIVFERVSFRYPSSFNGFRLENIDLEVKAGQVVALVGPSGAGKSTLVQLLPRFYDVTGGAVRIDGRDVRDLQLASLRGKISIVPQDTFLFNDTVANNIRYGRQDVSMRGIREASRNALCEEFILQMPQGYETVIGERGLKLSGGQRQRIAIARALLENAPILILDEATSPPGLRIGDAGPEGPGDSDDRTHRHRDRAPAFHHPAGGLDRGPRPGAHSRKGQPRGAGERGRHLPEALRTAIPGGRRALGLMSIRSMTGFARVQQSSAAGRSRGHREEREPPGPGHPLPHVRRAGWLRERLRAAIKRRALRGHFQVRVTLTRSQPAACVL